MILYKKNQIQIVKTIIFMTNKKFLIYYLELFIVIQMEKFLNLVRIVKIYMANNN
mgnify:CR=1 FL=1